MSQVVQAKCPFCRNVLRIPADWLAQPMRCKFCQQVIQAKEPTQSAAAALSAGATFAAPAESATAVVSGPPHRVSGDPFSFDDEPEAAPLAGSRRRKQGKGLIIAAALLAALTTVAVLVVVFAGPQLRALFQGKNNVEIVENQNQEKPAENGADKGIDPDKNAAATDGGAA